jgi:hypothetical protein
MIAAAELVLGSPAFGKPAVGNAIELRQVRVQHRALASRGQDRPLAALRGREAAAIALAVAGGGPGRLPEVRA